MTGTNLEIARAAFERIAQQCAPLTYELQETPDHEAVDLTLRFPEQPGLGFEVEANLVGVELHLCAGPYWHDHYGVKNKEVVAGFVHEAVALIRGEYRLLVSLKNDRPIKCALQCPSDEGWATVSVFGLFRLPFGKRTERVIQNTAFAQVSPSSS